MGRRSLRAIDAELDLSKHLFMLEDLPQPCTSQVLFNNTQPLEIEVGSGKGLFIRAAASEEPTHNFVGIEVAKKYARFAGARLAKSELPNALMIDGDAKRLLDEWVPENSVHAVHVYFPDPWWKARHRKRRVMDERFVRRIEQVLEPGGKLHFWTDVEEYFQSALETLAQETALIGPEPVAVAPAMHDLDYRTHFERRMRMHGVAVHRSLFRKTLSDAPLSQGTGNDSCSPLDENS